MNGSICLFCGNGVRKDSLVNAAFDMLTEEQKTIFQEKFAEMGLDKTNICLYNDRDEQRMSISSGQSTSRIIIKHDGLTESEFYEHRQGHHDHHSLDEVRAVIDALNVSARVRKDALAVYDILADAEAHAHDTSVDQVHFHEVGNAYAIAYIVAFCMLIEILDPSEIVATPIATGFGFVECAHGRLPIPAPATANVLQGLPTIKGEIEAELTTPTGAAMVRHFAGRYVSEAEARAGRQ